MKKSHIIAGLMVASLSLATIDIALAKPDKVPQQVTSTSNINGIFADYFKNLADYPCNNNIVTGFESINSGTYLTPVCKGIKTILASFLSSAMTSPLPAGSLIGFHLDGTPEVFNTSSSSSGSSQWGDVTNGIAYTGSATKDNVAIGTDDASYGKLYVAGKTIVGDATGNYTGTGWDHALQVNGGMTGIPSIGFNNNGTVGALLYSSAIGFVMGGDIGWGVTNITMPGNVGIGTNASSLAALTVSGVVIADTPTAPKHLATKAYVDAMLGNNGGGGCAVIGGTCGGGILAGVSRGYHIIITPPGCTDSTTPTCDHYGTDTVKKTWNNGTNHWTTTNQISQMDGNSNTMNLVSNTDAGSPYQAAKYCADMIYGGQDDWYLPSAEEAGAVVSNFALLSGGFTTGAYWLSSEWTKGFPGAGGSQNSAADYISTSTANGTNQISNGGGGGPKNSTFYVRCIRKM